ncbi:hypothetical protein CMUST_14425 [Corynebacterium mustelae]|uniref:Uncharacterized protein n=1 Tax=Corynebacterium mustelae TaxID=571915 RepID=A0A0G3H5S9_9CORY|nr:hypothetical protein CMUST_14425 [Corynebacterium mustelae]
MIAADKNLEVLRSASEYMWVDGRCGLGNKSFNTRGLDDVVHYKFRPSAHDWFALSIGFPHRTE